MIRAKSSSTRLLRWGRVVILMLALPFGLWHGLVWLGWGGSRDYSARPPAETFKWVTGRPVPAGVKNLRVAGRSYPGGWRHWVWMSFGATDAAIRALVEEEEPLDPAAAHQYIQSFGRLSVNPRYDARDKAWVCWNEVGRIAKPEVYSIRGGAQPHPFIWYRALIVDRKAHRGYIMALGD